MELVSDEVFDFVYGMAVSDAMIYAGSREAIKKNIGIKRAVAAYANKIISGKCREKSMKSLFETTVNNIIEANKNSKDKSEDMCFGRAQKLINMTMKYLYIRYKGKSESIYFDCCYAPMDRNMIEKVYGAMKGKEGDVSFLRETAWSKIGMTGKEKYAIKNYWEFQDAVQALVDGNNTRYRNRIEFDYFYWSKGIAESIALMKSENLIGGV